MLLSCGNSYMLSCIIEVLGICSIRNEHSAIHPVDFLQIAMWWLIGWMFPKGLNIERIQETLTRWGALGMNTVQFPGNWPWVKTWGPWWFYLLLWASHWNLSESGSSPPDVGPIAMSYKVPFRGHSGIPRRSVATRLRPLLGGHGKSRQLPSSGQ